MSRVIGAGINFITGKKIQYFIDESTRRKHIYVIGNTGSGKSTFIATQIVQDIYNGRGICLIEPHGDMSEEIINYIPKHRINDTIYFDIGNKDSPIGFNPFASLADYDLIASQFVSVCHKFWGDSWGTWLEYLLRQSVLSVLYAEGNSATIISIYRLLTNKGYIENLIMRLHDPCLLSFWQDFFLTLNQQQVNEKISSTINKIGALIASPVLRNILGQARPKLDIERVMNGKQILIINLAKGKIGEDNANFLGSLLISYITQIAYMRAEIAEEYRTDFYLYVDEFQNFTTKSFASILSEARKYRLNLCLANQFLFQIDEMVRNSIFGNVGTLCIYSTGYEDSAFLAKRFNIENITAFAEQGTGYFQCISRQFGHKLIDLEAYHSLDFGFLRIGSYSRVARNSIMRFSRSKEQVERQINNLF